MGTSEGARLEGNAEMLLAQSQWVRDLARSLVGDAPRGDDVAQETWLAALKHAPAEESELRPWLVRVATNFARQLRRGEANRRSRETSAARAEALPSVSETVERLELQRLLLDELEAIDEPFRTTIRLRYFDGLSAADIARRADIPAGTVRWRLKRGLDLLRERLDHRFDGERRAWCLAFLPFLDRPPVLETATAGLSVLPGVWVMSAMTKSVLISALAVSAALFAWKLASEDAPIASATPSLAAAEITPPVPVARALAPATELVAAEPAAQRDEIEAVETEAPPKPAMSPIDDARIEARFVDAEGRGIAGVAFGLRGVPAEEHVSSAADGTASLAAQLPEEMWPSHLEASVAGYATWFQSLLLVRGKTTNLGEVVLAPGGAVAGIVLGRDGAPIANATVLAMRPELEAARDIEDARRLGPASWADTPSTQSHSDGTFRLDGVPAAVVRVWAGASGTRFSVSEPIELLPRQVHGGITLTLDPLEDKDTISGIVVGPDGSPVPDARISYSYRSEHESGTSSFTGGSDGRFDLKLLKLVPHDFSARDMEGRWPNVGRIAVQPGTHDLVLAFALARTFELAVSCEGGAPVETYHVRVRTADGRREITRRDAKDRERGKLAIEAPGEPFEMLVSAKGKSEERVGPFESDSVPETVRVSLTTLPGVHGRVLREKRGLAGAEVKLFAVAESDERIEHNGFLTRLRPTPVESDITDSDGRFWLTAREAGKFAIVCTADGLAPTELSPLVVDPQRGVDGLEIVMSEGGVIEGRVRARVGREPAGTLVAANRFDADPRIVRVGSDGTFRLEHVTPGGWEITKTDREFSASSTTTSSSSGDGVTVHYTPNCEVHEGKVTRFELDLTDLAPVLLAGSVMVNDKPALGWTAEIWPAGVRNSPSSRVRASVDGSGRLSVELPGPGAYRIALHSPAEVVPEVVLETELELVPGANPWIVDFDTGVVEGRLASPNSNTRLSYVWQGDEGLSATISIPVDGSTFRASAIPAGTGLLVAWGETPDEHGKRSEQEVLVEVKRGEVTRVEVP